MTDKLSAFVIGADSLLIECCKVLQNSNIEILGVISSAPRIQQWIQAQPEGRDIQLIPEAGFEAFLEGAGSFDFLFAITHLRIIPDHVLTLPKRGTINFHDSLLPRYAGLNAPTWALRNREMEFGISWHEVTAGIDEGDILKQRQFAISEDESALTLNTRCFEHAINSFEELVAELGNDQETRTPQNLENRTYFGRYDRPDGACLIDWRKSAEEIHAEVRALQFGPYRNPVGSPKICFDKKVFILQECAIAEGDKLSPDSIPGEITRVSADAIHVTSGEGTLIIKSINTLEGNPEPLSVLGKPGEFFYQPDSEEIVALTSLDQKLARHEEFWHRRLATFSSVSLPWAQPSQNRSGVRDRVAVDLPAGLSGELVVPAFTVLVGRLTGATQFDLDLLCPSDTLGTVTDRVPLRVHYEPQQTFAVHTRKLNHEFERMNVHRTFLCDLVARRPELVGKSLSAHIGLSRGRLPTANDPELCLMETQGHYAFDFDPGRISLDTVKHCKNLLIELIRAIQETPEKALGMQTILSEDERLTLTVQFNDTTDLQIDRRLPCAHEMFEKQAKATPFNTAVIFKNNVINYLNLNSRANQLAHYLIGAGVGPDVLVGIYLDRSFDMLIAMLAVLKAGGAFVPMDPAFPRNRLSHIFEDSGSRLLLTQEHLSIDAPIPMELQSTTRILCLDADWQSIATGPTSNPGINANHTDLAYVIYTSGSTGQPKGVMIEHRNLANFFAAMDENIQHDEHSTWLAVTSLSFDISILELLWTLTTGVKLVILDDNPLSQAAENTNADRTIDFSLFMWGSDGSVGQNKYQLMLEAARYADDHGFLAIWTPERHFNQWGGPYPNPAITAAAIAAVTKNLQIRAGSCVVPLHHPIRVAEDWAVVDNISNGRIGIAAASGWQPADFVIFPAAFNNNREVLFENIEKIQRLWRGESVEFPGVNGEPIAVSTQPRPLQQQLPLWITSAGNVETFVRAGSIGANLLTHLLGQSVEQVAEKIAAYRQALRDSGFDPASRTVTLMLHTLVGEDTNTVRAQVNEPLKDYLRGSISLLADNVWAFPTFRRPGDTSSSIDGVDIADLEPEDVEAIVDFSFERYFGQSGLFGTPERCMAMVEQLKAIDVDEIGCLIDYGLPPELVLNSLPALAELKDRANHSTRVASDVFSFAELVNQHKVTHLQCTPSMLRMLNLQFESRDALMSIEHLLIGGEALPVDLANAMLDGHKGTLSNMYGPTETTIWSSIFRLHQSEQHRVPIGEPIRNTQMYVLDAAHQLLPIGVAGDLFIAGEGVARGYRDRPSLTQEKFLDNPFRPGERMYKTGDIARWSAEGSLEYLGRSDFQVKVRGFRIELGEIEACLLDLDSVSECVVIHDVSAGGVDRLLAYIVANAHSPAASEDELRTHLRQQLPEYMIPAQFVSIDAIPQTPNGKTDRNALPNPAAVTTNLQNLTIPDTSTEEQLLHIWQDELALTSISVTQSFFDVGGNSLLLVAVHRKIKSALGMNVALVDLYRYPTIRALAGYLDNTPAHAGSLEVGKQRARSRLRRTTRRRGPASNGGDQKS